MQESPRKLPWRERLNISRLAIQYSWLTLGFWIAVAVAGVLAFSSLKYALFPDITFPVVVVNASAPIETALETEKSLTQPIEAQLQQLYGVTDVGSTTYPGQTVVSVRFQVGSNLEESSQTVEATLKTLKLPPDATSKVIPINLNEAAVASYAIESDTQSLEELTKVTQDQIIPAIAKLPGVLKVNLLGEPTSIDLTKLTKLEDAFSQIGTAVRFNGQPALAFQVIKQGDANTLEVGKQVEETVNQLQTTLPNLQLILAATQTDYIQAATGETIHALIEAIILCIIVIFPFLGNWRATFISALAIPMSLLGTFMVMASYGFSLETITLLALAMAIGNIVDDAIVDVENISRHLENGEPPKRAALLATSEIGLTVTAATLTAVAVFLPVGMMKGVLGQFFKPFGITISAAMLTSLLVARTLSPLLATYWLKSKPKPASDAPPPSPHWLDKLNQNYRHLLDWSLAHRWIIVSLALGSFIAGLALIPLIPKGFIPKLDRGEFLITYVTPQPEIPQELLATRQAAEQQARQAAELAAQGLISPDEIPQIPELPPFNPLQDSIKVASQLDSFVNQSLDVENVFTVVGSRQGEPNKGTIYVQLKPERSLTTADFQDKLRRELPEIQGVSTSIEDIQFVDTGGEKPVQIRIVGEDLAALNKAAQEIKTKLADIPGLEDVSTSVDENRGDQIIEIRRNDQQRIATISANLGQGLTIGEASDRAVEIAESILPPGISLKLAGDSAQVNEILSSFAKTLTLSIFCILAVLLLLFRSLSDTFVIFLSLPLSIVGATLGLLVTRSDFGMISLIGIIFLLGLTNKNAILIVDYINQLRRKGSSRKEAILEAAPVRLRPILMTTSSTILGMLPLALGLGAGAELRSPMAVAIIGGLVTSTLLSLLVIPVIYDLLDDWRSHFQKQRS